jgi:hypothetical protein
MEQNIDIKKNTGKDGKEYNNLYLKEIEDGNYIVVEKIFLEGLKRAGKFGKPVYSVGVKYKDELCSCWMNDKVYPDYQATGVVGDRIKISAKEEKVVLKTGVKILVMRYTFEKV